VHQTLLIILALLFCVSMLAMLGQKLRISYPIFLVIGGLLISFVPGIPRINIDPDLVFLIFLPPLLYEAAWQTSWRNFWKFRRAIGLLGFGLVLFTSCIVAVVSQAIIPGFTLALGFLLGGIISPPDAVAATSVLKGLSIPKRIVTILEGESLVNDAASLIVFRFALAAVFTGAFHFQHAVVEFFIATLMGIAVGLIIAHIFYMIHRWMPTTANIDTALTFMSPYFMYMAAEYFHYSGVMAVVSGGLFLSFRSHQIFNYNSRIQSNSVWSTVTFLLNGIVFILIGLQLPYIVDSLGDNYSVPKAIFYGLIISVLTILIRVVWVYPATFLPRWLSGKVRKKEAKPSWQGVFLVSWAGMRGVVSLSSALSIPLTLFWGDPFPQRNLILFITFVVILFTLVFQGLTLPFVIKWLNIKDPDTIHPEDEQETAIRLVLLKVAREKIVVKYAVEVTENELLGNLKLQLESNISLTTQRLESLEGSGNDQNEVEQHNRVLHDLIKTQRKELARLRKEKHFDEEVLRKHEAQLDLDEARLNQHIV
jgi:Na+/H+ antiporter